MNDADAVELASLMRELIGELRQLRETIAENSANTERAAYWTAQSFRGKDSAGNPR